jgi:hypothetical protein
MSGVDGHLERDWCVKANGTQQLKLSFSRIRGENCNFGKFAHSADLIVNGCRKRGIVQ